MTEQARQTGGQDLPRVLRALWRLDPKPRPGPKPGLSLDVILAKGIEIADADGLAALSMSRLATELGFTTMSLYRYVANKDELLTLLADAASGLPPDIGDDVVGWRDRLRVWVWAQMEGLRQRPWIVQLPITGVPMGPNTLTWIDRGLAELAPTGLTEAEKVGVIGLIAGLVRHESLVRTDIRRAQESTDGNTEALLDARDFNNVLGAIVDPTRLPALAASLAARAWEEQEDMDADFSFGLERILDGVEALAQTRLRTSDRAPRL